MQEKLNKYISLIWNEQGRIILRQNLKIPVIVLRCLGILIMYLYRNPAIFLLQVLGTKSQKK